MGRPACNAVALRVGKTFALPARNTSKLACVAGGPLSYFGKKYLHVYFTLKSLKGKWFCGWKRVVLDVESPANIGGFERISLENQVGKLSKKARSFRTSLSLTH